MECIGRLVEKNKDGRIKGFKPSSKSAPFLHQKFVDDTIMGGEASIKEANEMKYIFDVYSRGSGQLINWDKSSIFFINSPKDRQKKNFQNFGVWSGEASLYPSWAPSRNFFS